MSPPSVSVAQVTVPAAHERRDLRRLALVGVLILAWSSTFTAMKVGLEDAPPMLFAGLRCLIGGGVMALLAGHRHGGPGLREHARAYLLLTLFNVLGFLGLQTFAINELPSGLGGVLIYLQPVLTAMLAGPLLGEWASRVRLLGAVVAFAGILIVGSDALAGHVSVAGVVFAMGGALCWSLGTIAFKREAAAVDPWWAVAVPFVAGGSVLGGVGVATEGLAVSWSPSFVASLLWVSLIGVSTAWALWFYLVGSGEAATAAAAIFAVPLVAVVLGALVLDEQIKPTLLLGAGLVILGVWLVNRPQAPRVASRDRVR